MKAEQKRLEIHKSLVRSLIVKFIFLDVNQIVQTMKARIFMLLNLLGLLMINLALAVLSSQFKKSAR